MSQLRQTATFAPLGQLLGVSFRPARIGATHCLICSSVSLVPGCGLFSCCASSSMGSMLNIKARRMVLKDFLFMVPSCFGYCSGINSKVASVFALTAEDRKSTRLNSSHGYISYAVFCL